MARSYTFSDDGVRRIVNTVRAYERGNRDQPAIRLRQAGDDGGEPIRIAKVVSAWPHGDTRELELVYEDDCGEEGSGSGETLEAHNKLFDIPADSIVELARARNGCWYVVGVGCRVGGSGSDGSGSCDCMAIGGQDLATLPGYDAAKIQILGHEYGCLQWFDTDDCGSGSS